MERQEPFGWKIYQNLTTNQKDILLYLMKHRTGVAIPTLGTNEFLDDCYKFSPDLTVDEIEEIIKVLVEVGIVDEAIAYDHNGQPYSIYKIIRQDIITFFSPNSGMAYNTNDFTES